MNSGAIFQEDETAGLVLKCRFGVVKKILQRDRFRV